VHHACRAAIVLGCATLLKKIALCPFPARPVLTHLRSSASRRAARAAMNHSETLLLMAAFGVSAGLLWLAASIAMAAATRGASVAVVLLGHD